MQLKSSQKTYRPGEKDTVKKWFIVDIKGKTLGHVATKIADLLRGKGKPFFTPQQDCGDYVVIINAKSVRLAGNKLDTKMYQWHTRYPSGFREKTARQILTEKPEKVIFDAVRGMLPRNRLRNHIIKKLRIFPGQSHDHTAQKLSPLEL